MTTKLLCVQSGVGGIETQYYFVDRSLRGALSKGMRDCIVIPWWSLRDKRWLLWIASHNPGNSWFDSLQVLLQAAGESHKGKAWTIESNRDRAKYDPSWYDLEDTVKIPLGAGRPISQMLGQALGEKHFIRNPEHKVYQTLTAGEPVL